MKQLQNIRKFLVFQLSINLVAMISAAVGALYGGVPPLNVLQLLWYAPAQKLWF